ncbi:7TM-DISM domain-containing protein [Gilvimarinus sp. SDUM040013]|uniref:7TM-DISM domain-containing protein n=1 Tax=Gilvimarinus gilvus TaxID=3058038 RepID=A0ABU4RYB6_9GAMM|nr:7TM-DISM domain-containing protein [Gilvimarinus sp. SDUM040013]MDO3388485.1 7TM-DISM domain-containing protein [Gilvimarinus sp. SDUM040013]MDX6848643.1 7TM-DISM domain-containing protein [Gilvimarinus sp. SDUM040013]
MLTNTFMRQFLCVLLLFFSAFAMANQHGKSNTLEQLDAQVLLKAPALSIDQAVSDTRWQSYQKRDSNQGIGNQLYWLRFAVANNSDAPNFYILSTETTYIDNIIVYQRTDANKPFTVTALSDREPFAQRPLFYRTLATPLQIPAISSSEIYIQAFNSNLIQ